MTKAATLLEVLSKKVQYLTREEGGKFTSDYNDAGLWALQPAIDICLERDDVAMYPDASGNFVLIKTATPPK